MKKITRYICALLLSAACVSCMTPFDLKYDDEPLICLNAFPGAEDMVVFSITPAYSLSNSAIRPDFNPEVVFTVNGDLVPVVRNTGFCVSDRYDEDCYIADIKPVPGDVMTVEVAAEGFRTVSAQTSIPQPFPERKIDYRMVEVNEREYYVVYVTIKDDAATDYAYGMQVYNEVVECYYDVPEVRISTYAGGQISEDYEFSPSSLDGMQLCFDGWRVNSSMWDNVSCWDDDAFDGKENTLSMTVVIYHTQNGYESFFEHEYQAWKYDENRDVMLCGTGRERNKLVFFTMSDEFYKYAVAQELIEENAGSFAGIAPSNFCYSNVQNGYGAFAGVYREETQWITPEFIENNR